MSESKALVNYEKMYAEAADEQASALRPSGSGGTTISTRSGILKFGDEQLPGNQMCVIVLDNVHENTFYPGKWNEGDKAPPVCYAFGRGDGSDMAPYEGMQVDLDYFEPQSDDCKSCPKNVYGSADVGQGKACKNRERLALIPAGMYSPKKGSRDFDLDIFSDPKDFMDGETAYLRVPPTSLAEWDAYVKQIRAAHRRPAWGVLTRVYCEPHPKHQYHVKFEMIELLPDDFVKTVMARVEMAKASTIQAYAPPRKE